MAAPAIDKEAVDWATMDTLIMDMLINKVDNFNSYYCPDAANTIEDTMAKFIIGYFKDFADHNSNSIVGWHISLWIFELVQTPAISSDPQKTEYPDYWDHSTN